MRTGVDAATFTYGDAAHKHAVTQVGATAYTYDANGNMLSRGSDSLLYDQENRLYRITVGGTQTDYTYNADSARVKKVVGSTTTYYVGNWYEVTNGAVTKYYYFGAQRVAMRTSAGVTYLHGDHLGSTSATSGAINSSSTYYPFGTVRSGTLPTDYTFTGQKNDADAGLMYYNARYYDANIGRFTQADTIVPNLYNPQSLNRYSYVLNNPIKYTDPTGHREDCDDGPCPPLDRTYSKVIRELGSNPDGLHTWSNDELVNLLGWIRAGVRFTSVPHPNFEGSRALPWTADNLRAIVKALDAVRAKYPDNYLVGLGLSGGTLTFNSVAASYEGPGAIGGRYNIATNTITLSLWSGTFDPGSPLFISTIESALHEMGHAFDARLGRGNYWSANSLDWARAIAANVRAAASNYALTNPVEDFADTFVFSVLGRPLQYPTNGYPGSGTGIPSRERRDALTVAINQLKQP